MAKRKQRDESQDAELASAEDTKTFREQIRDLKPLYVRRDPCFNAWELKFLCDMTASAEIKTFVPTVGQAYKTNQIYEQKYLRGTYS